MATLRKDGRYQAVYRDPTTGQRKTVYGMTNREAEDAKRVALQAANATTEGNGPTPSIELTLHDLAGLLWFPEVLASARPNTIRKYRVAYDHHIRPRWGSRTIDTIRPAEVQRWINDMMATGIPPASISFYRGLLSGILKRCAREGIVATNAASFARMPKRPKRVRYADIDTIKRLLASVEGTPLAAPVFLAAVLGMRRGEVCGLRWTNIDRDQRRIRVSEQRMMQRQPVKGKQVRTGELKTAASVRSFRLPPLLFDALERVGNLDSDYVCTGPTGKPWNPEKLTEYWAHRRDELGFADWHYHDLRHAAASTLAALGVDLLTIASILGHQKVDMTQVYAHAQERTASIGFDALAKAIFGS